MEVGVHRFPERPAHSIPRQHTEIRGDLRDMAYNAVLKSRKLSAANEPNRVFRSAKLKPLQVLVRVVFTGAHMDPPNVHLENPRLYFSPDDLFQSKVIQDLRTEDSRKVEDR